MSPTPTRSRRLPGQRGQLHVERARALLSEGRNAEALEAVRRARRLRGGGEAAYVALLHWEALLGLRRCHEALAIATRALRRAAPGSDQAVRLRIARGQSLWLIGRVGPGEVEVQKARALAREPLTLARAEETLAFFAWKRQDLEAAQRHIAAALAVYAQTGCASGMFRTLGRDAGALRDAGRLEDALAVEDRRLSLARELGRADLSAQVRCERGGLLVTLGRWDDAKSELDEAARLFREAGDPREFTSAGMARVGLDLARGELGAARSTLERAREIEAERGHTRALARNLLLTSDALLAGGELEAAERTAVEALGLFRATEDAEGECRSRVRRAHALIGMSRVAEARAEARRALRSACAARSDLQALALIALGRAQLRTRASDAEATFEEVLRLPYLPPADAHAAGLGLALARSAASAPADLNAAFRALEGWGDRRLLAIAAGEVRRLAGAEAVREVREADAATPLAEGSDAVGALVDAATALWTAATWREAWPAAARALRAALPWCRALLLEQGAAWEVRAETIAAVPLAEDDLAREVAAHGAGPRIVDLARDPLLRTHPQRLEQRAGGTLLAPVADGILLCLETREERGAPTGRDLGLVVQFARLLSARPREEEASTDPQQAFPEIVGRCEGMQQLFSGMARVAQWDDAVYVFGETGTGKEKVAQAVHRASRRSAGRFVAVNASSLSEGFFEAEMFGHTRGAFTGAVAERLGLASEAQAGTLFIDEVTDLCPRVQAKLLRFLQQGEYRRLGENVLRRVDFRLITASNLRLEEAVKTGRFREDLMYRLNRLMLALPPLRERGDDVLLLARHFLAAAASKVGLRPPALTQEAARVLRTFAWPGNIRQLESETARMLMAAGTGPIRKEHLSPELFAAKAAPNAPLRAAVSAFERDFIGQSLRRNGGNRARTACALGLTRQALVAKIARYGIS